MAFKNIKNYLVIFLLNIYIISCVGLSSRINGGDFADEFEAPYMVGIVNRNSNQFVCGASILSKRTVVSSVFGCLRDLEDAAILAGSLYLNSADMKKYNIDKVLIHPEYMGLTNNLGLAFLDQDIEFSDKIQPIALDTNRLSDGAVVTIFGWGEDHTAGPNMNALKKLYVVTMNQEACEQRLQGSIELVEHHLCTETYIGGEACKKDAGGPVVKDGKLVAVYSYAFGLCGQRVPHTSSRMSSFAEWINENMI